MVMARMGSSGRLRVMSPPNRPTITYLPPLASASMPSFAVLAAPTKSMAAPIGALAAACACFTASGAAASIAARAPALSAGVALLGIDVGDDGAEPAHRLEQCQAHEAQAARAEDQDRLLGEDGLADALQGAVSGDAGAGEGRRLRRVSLPRSSRYRGCGTST